MSDAGEMARWCKLAAAPVDSKRRNVAAPLITNEQIVPGSIRADVPRIIAPCPFLPYRCQPANSIDDELRNAVEQGVREV